MNEPIVVVGKSYREAKEYIRGRLMGTSLDKYRKPDDFIYVNADIENCNQLRGVRTDDIRLLVPWDCINSMVRMQLDIISNLRFFKAKKFLEEKSNE